MKGKEALAQFWLLCVVMYGCESWAVKKAERQRIDAFELWCWRRLRHSGDLGLTVVSQPLPAGAGIGLGHCKKLKKEVGMGVTFLNELVFQMLFLFFIFQTLFHCNL